MSDLRSPRGPGTGTPFLQPVAAEPVLVDPARDGSFARGLEVRKSVLGAAHVERAFEGATDFDRDFQAYITRAAWGEVWTRPGLSIQTRQLLTIVMLAALNRPEELTLHLEATANTGLSAEEISEALMQVAVYAGVPAANAAIKIAKRVLAARAVAGSKEAGTKEPGTSDG